ncbi:MAG: hypothetical protein IT178_09150 [Acidobacteria bacterium]|nr:hypothetical protein [Acidobacteriota bacterium]
MIRAVSRQVQDAKAFAANQDIRFSSEGLAVLKTAELLAHELDDYLYLWTLMPAILRLVGPVRRALALEGGDADDGAAIFEEYTRTSKGGGGTAYDDGDGDGYSTAYGDRSSSTRTHLIDFAIAHARREGRPIDGVILFAALMDSHEAIFPAITHGNLTDERLHTRVILLAHILGCYHRSLAVSLNSLRDHLGLPIPTMGERHPLELAPPYARSATSALLADHPEYHRNCFLVMPFTDTPAHREIAAALKKLLLARGFNLVRADDGVYSEDVMTNVLAYIYGCRFGIAVFERIVRDTFNPNVSLEVGYLMGLGKPVCLLKERTLPHLQSDLVGRLYEEFDAQDLASSLANAVDDWLVRRGMLRRKARSAARQGKPAGTKRRRPRR